MSTYALIHGGGDSGWYWHLVEAELHGRGHRVIAPDLPADDESASLSEYADVVVDQVGDAADLVVVGQSFGAFTAPLVADRLPTSALVLVAGMAPSPGEPPADWWENTRYGEVARDPDVDDPIALYYHDVPEEIAVQALARERRHPSTRAYSEPWPLDRWPDVPTRFVLGTEDRVFPAAFLRRVALDRIGVVAEELACGHCVALARPRELARLLCGG